MDAARRIHIGMLTPHNADRPHFKAIRVYPRKFRLLFRASIWLRMRRSMAGPRKSCAGRQTLCAFMACKA